MGLDGIRDRSVFLTRIFLPRTNSILFIQMLRGSWRHAPDQSIGRMTSRFFASAKPTKGSFMTNQKMSLSAFLLAIATLAVGAYPAFAAPASPLGTASSFAVLSAAPAVGGAVTCTDSTITGNVGSSGAAASVVQTGCPITGVVTAPVSAQVLTDFNDAYAAIAATSCDETLTGTLAGVTLAPGVYCFDAAATLTGTLTLAGDPSAVWIFKIGTSGTGALTGTNFSVVVATGMPACNVTWWVAQAATLTDSNFKGSILAGAAISATGGPTAKGTFEGQALAKAAVTFTNEAFVGCSGDNQGGGHHDGDGCGHGGHHGSGHHGKDKHNCNQGVGNGREGCDPGNSNHGNPFGSNDEQGGMPGNPGRKGGKK